MKTAQNLNLGTGTHSHEVSGRGVKLTTLFQLVPKLRMNTATPTLPHVFTACTGTTLPLLSIPYTECNHHKMPISEVLLVQSQDATLQCTNLHPAGNG